MLTGPDKDAVVAASIVYELAIAFWVSSMLNPIRINRAFL